MKTIKPPHSIEMEKAEDWQKEVEDYFEDKVEYTLFNPRRDDGDSNWEQKFENPHFY